MRNILFFLLAAVLLRSVPANAMVRLGIEGIFGWQTFNMKDGNNWLRGKGRTPFNESAFNPSGRVFLNFDEKFWIGAQGTYYNMTNGGTLWKSANPSLPDTLSYDEYRAIPIYLVLGLNVLNRSAWHWDFYGGMGTMLKNEYTYKVGGVPVQQFYSTHEEHKKIYPYLLGTEILYTFAHSHFGLGLSATYTGLKTTFSGQHEMNLSGMTYAGNVRIEL